MTKLLAALQVPDACISRSRAAKENNCSIQLKLPSEWTVVQVAADGCWISSETQKKVDVLFQVIPKLTQEYSAVLLVEASSPISSLANSAAAQAVWFCDFVEVSADWELCAASPSTDRALQDRHPLENAASHCLGDGSVPRATPRLMCLSRVDASTGPSALEKEGLGGV